MRALRESGAIEQDADMVIFLYRPEYYGFTQDESGRSTAGVAEVIIAKHRNGSLDTVPLRFQGKFIKFSDLEVDSFGFNNDSGISPLSPSTDFNAMGTGGSGTITLASKNWDKHDDDNVPF